MQWYKFTSVVMIVGACLISASNFDYEISSSLFLIPCGLPSFIDVFNLLLPFSTSQNLGIKSAVKIGDYKPRNWLER
jgi:hypothetical protein